MRSLCSPGQFHRRRISNIQDPSGRLCYPAFHEKATPRVQIPLSLKPLHNMLQRSATAGPLPRISSSVTAAFNVHGRANLTSDLSWRRNISALSGAHSLPAAAVPTEKRTRRKDFLMSNGFATVAGESVCVRRCAVVVMLDARQYVFCPKASFRQDLNCQSV